MREANHTDTALWWAAVVAGTNYLVVTFEGWSGPLMTAWKGSGVALLALWAWRQASSDDGRAIAVVLGFGAAGDILLEIGGLLMGGTAFAVGHILAIRFYRRHQRTNPGQSQKALAASLLGLGTLIAALLLLGPLVHNPPLYAVIPTVVTAIAATIYGAIVAAMAASAWLSRFPRYRTGIGAVCFLVSDLLIFARLFYLADEAWINPAIWVLYFGGQALIAWGVVRTLTTEARGRAA